MIASGGLSKPNHLKDLIALPDASALASAKALQEKFSRNSKFIYEKVFSYKIFYNKTKHIIDSYDDEERKNIEVISKDIVNGITIGEENKKEIKKVLLDGSTKARKISNLVIKPQQYIKRKSKFN